MGPARTLAGDDATRRAFLRYWRALSPFIGIVLRAQLATIAHEASRKVAISVTAAAADDIGELP